MELSCRDRQDELEKVWWEEQAELGARAAPGSAKGGSALPEGEEVSVGWQVCLYILVKEDVVLLQVKFALDMSSLELVNYCASSKGS